ncbi:hypothetical protein TNCT_166611 [Trichonephila clavata]|uniref:Uncharacterized protein n=1 Tax=Trichonephila clavata TaxID=2740835 RepID=A0A8X6H8Z2_TRICU|nr:hypothetical protein TNCT_166611 [Trichonephila clavata]
MLEVVTLSNLLKPRVLRKKPVPTVSSRKPDVSSAPVPAGMTRVFGSSLIFMSPTASLSMPPVVVINNQSRFLLPQFLMDYLIYCERQKPRRD